MSDFRMVIVDGGGKFLYETSLGVNDGHADFTSETLGAKLHKLEWRDADGKIYRHYHDQGAFGYAILHGDARVAWSDSPPMVPVTRSFQQGDPGRVDEFVAAAKMHGGYFDPRQTSTHQGEGMARGSVFVEVTVMVPELSLSSLMAILGDDRRSMD